MTEVEGGEHPSERAEEKPETKVAREELKEMKVKKKKKKEKIEKEQNAFFEEWVRQR